MIKYVVGDLLKSDCSVIAHGCNCFHTMGGGIARQIKKMYPLALAVDKSTKYGDMQKLGTYSMATIEKGNGEVLHILNCYTQYNYGYGQRNCDYSAIRDVMLKIENDFDKTYKIGFPKIGCGLAGGDWNIVEAIISYVFGDREVFVYTID